MKAKQGIKFEQLAAGFERGIGALDELRVMQLGDGLRLQCAQNRVQAREYERLERKYGKDHPRTLNAAAKIELGKEHMQAISIVHTTASAPRPDPGNGWAVDGFVRTANGDPVSGVTVAAYDRQEHWYQELGYACTDEKGYFRMVAEKVPEKELSVYMRASKGKRLLESNEVRLVPAPKSSDRVEIIIGDIAGKGDCMPPAGGKEASRPPEKPVGGKEKPAAPVKEKSAPADSAKEVSKETTGGKTIEVKVDEESQKKAQEKELKKSEEERKKALEEQRQKFKEKGSKPDAGGGSKRSGPKKRRQ